MESSEYQSRTHTGRTESRQLSTVCLFNMRQSPVASSHEATLITQEQIALRTNCVAPTSGTAIHAMPVCVTHFCGTADSCHGQFVSRDFSVTTNSCHGQFVPALHAAQMIPVMGKDVLTCPAASWTHAVDQRASRHDCLSDSSCARSLIAHFSRRARQSTSGAAATRATGSTVT